MERQKKHVVVVGGGISGLSAAAMLSAKGYRVTVLERNWMVGGCAGTYLRKHAYYETGATTLVGLEPYMPLGILAKATGISWEATLLEVPMAIHFEDGRQLTRHKDLEAWIQESEGFFGGRQSRFWETCYRLAIGVWKASGRYLDFPPRNAWDWAKLLPNFKRQDAALLPHGFGSTYGWIQRHGLHRNSDFMRFVEAQLLITAQNNSKETNPLFGATALAYPLVPNYYVAGGIGKIAESLANYTKAQGNTCLLRTEVLGLCHDAKGCWEIKTETGNLVADAVVSAVPVNQTQAWLGNSTKTGIGDIRTAESLWSAFQLNLELPYQLECKALHHQILLEEALPGTNSKSIFVSLSAPWDTERCAPGHQILSVSCHLGNPKTWKQEQKNILEEAVLVVLKFHGFLPAPPLYAHASGVSSWEKWTGRFAGTVGGYPQLRRIKPWHMNSGKTLLKGLFLAGDTVYPGQGIPGAALSGIIAAHLVQKQLPILP